MKKDEQKEQHIVGDMVFFIDRKHSAIHNSLIFIDDLLNDGHKIKDSRTTTAAVLELPGMKPVFVKRENNKGLKFTLKYLFRCSRVFRAAAAAAKLETLGIPTPKVLAVGSRRSHGVLKSGYLITETLDKVLTTDAVCQKMYEDQAFYELFMSEVSKMIGMMHENGITHGDLKLSNIYCKNSSHGYTFGLWDLDGVKIISGKVTSHGRAMELGRIISSYVRTASERDKQQISIDDMTTALLAHYHSHTATTVNADNVKRETRSFLKRYGINL